jgi:hypothetical protein
MLVVPVKLTVTVAVATGVKLLLIVEVGVIGGVNVELWEDVGEGTGVTVSDVEAVEVFVGTAVCVEEGVSQVRSNSSPDGSVPVQLEVDCGVFVGVAT